MARKGSKKEKIMVAKDDDTAVIQTTRKTAIFTAEPNPLTIEPTQPLIQSPVQRQSGLLDSLGASFTNDYDQADHLMLLDDRLRGNLDLYAKMVSRSFQGVDITQRGDLTNPRELDTNEIDMLITANNLIERLKFKRLYESYTKSLIKYGDVIEHIETDPSFLDAEFTEEAEATGAITGLTSLPMNQMTIIDEAKRIDDPNPSSVITQANIYVVDELSKDQTEEKPVQYPKEEILHISLDNRTNWKEDLIKRPTYGIWSDSPLKSVLYLIEWKHNIIRNDMLWRNKMLPREHHKLNMAAFSPENYPGSTFGERLNSAKVAATLEMNSYGNSIRGQQPDQGYVTSNDVSIEIVEPKSVNYQSPNELINQLDTKISSLTGTPEALSGGETTGFSSLEFSATFVAIRAEEMANLIGSALERIIWKHVLAIHPSVNIIDIKRIKLKHRLILDRDLSERAKVISILAGTKIFTPTELREIFGKEAMTTAQEEEIKTFQENLAAIVKFETNKGQTGVTGAGGSGKSVDATTADALQQSGSPTGNQQSKGKRLNDNVAIGDRKGQSPTSR